MEKDEKKLTSGRVKIPFNQDRTSVIRPPPLTSEHWSPECVFIPLFVRYYQGIRIRICELHWRKLTGIFVSLFVLGSTLAESTSVIQRIVIGLAAYIPFIRLR